jgi:hypothetical protein
VFTDLFICRAKLERLAQNYVACRCSCVVAVLWNNLIISAVVSCSNSDFHLNRHSDWLPEVSHRHWLAVIQPHFQIIPNFLSNPKSCKYAIKNKQCYHSPQYSVLSTFSGMYLEFFHLPYFVSRFVSIYLLTAKSKLFSLLSFIVAVCLFNPLYAGVVECCKPSSLTAVGRSDRFSNIEFHFRKPLRDWL